MASPVASETRVLPHPPPQQQGNIEYLIDTLATKTKVQLLWHAVELNRRGNELKSLHPLSFMLHVVQSETLTSKLGLMYENQPIWGRFWPTMSKSLQEWSDQGKITEDHASEFAQCSGLDREKTVTVIVSNDWDKFALLILGKG